MSAHCQYTGCMLRVCVHTNLQAHSLSLSGVRGVHEVQESTQKQSHHDKSSTLVSPYGEATLQLMTEWQVRLSDLKPRGFQLCLTSLMWWLYVFKLVFIIFCVELTYLIKGLISCFI